MPESAWGWLIITYLFLAGAGSGAFLAAVACDLLAPDWSKALARAGSLASGPLVIVGTACLVFDLEAGFWQPWRQLYLMSNFTSAISWGVIILSAFIPVALLYAAALNEISFVGRYAKKYVRFLEAIGSVSRGRHSGIYRRAHCGSERCSLLEHPGYARALHGVGSVHGPGGSDDWCGNHRYQHNSNFVEFCARAHYISRRRSCCAHAVYFHIIDTLC